jgi:DhnA family fructose-bisphosphate aldolase class Ia
MAFSKPRMNRLFAKSGKCFDIAIDHGIANEPSFLDGIEDMPKVVAALAEAGPDAIQLTPGQARLLQDLPGRQKPSLVLRADASNVYAGRRQEVYWCRMIEEPVEQALALDAAGVVLNLFCLTDQTDLHRQCVENVNRLKPACDRAGMPLMVEPLAMKPAGASGGYGSDGDLDRIVAVVRQARELGADLIKADPTDDLGRYGRVVQAAGGAPVLPRGGGKASIREIFQRTCELMRQGARGIVYGRNVFQHPDPGAMTRAFMAIVHEDASPEQALRILEGKARA